MLAEKEKGSPFNLVKLDIAGNKPATHAYIYNGKNEVVGTVTSAMWWPAAEWTRFARPPGALRASVAATRLG